MLAVLERQTHGRIRVGIVRLELLAVDLDDRCLGIDAGAVLTVHIVIRGDRFDRVGVDDGGAVVRERLAVDRHVVDDRVVQVIEVCAIDDSIVIKINRTIAASGAGLTHQFVDRCRLITQPKHTEARENTQWMFIILIRQNAICFCRAIHPSGPVNSIRTVPCCQEQIFINVVSLCAIPNFNIRTNPVWRCAFRRVDPNADFCR